MSKNHTYVHEGSNNMNIDMNMVVIREWDVKIAINHGRILQNDKYVTDRDDSANVANLIVNVHTDK